ncbi:hypothetical protein MNBD_GAMMA25-2260, partial [hydrothermal vent metagenome]
MPELQGLSLNGGGVQQLDVFMIRNSARRINFGTIKLQQVLESGFVHPSIANEKQIQGLIV